MKRPVLVLVVAFSVLLGTASQAPAQATKPSAVTPWIEFELRAIASHRLNPPRASHALAHVSRAMYLAALVAAPPARDDAVAGAASIVLSYLFPDEAVRIDALTGAAARAARGDLARLEPRSQVGVSPRSAASLWQHALPRRDERGAHSLPDADRRAEAGRRLLGRRGGHRHSAGTLERDRTRSRTKRRPVDSTHGQLFAALNTAQADAFIACWDAKYAYWSLRPVTAVRRLIDPSWLSYIATPPFPSYPSGHSTTSGAASTVLAAFFPARAGQLAALAEEAAVSRLYGGIRYTTDNQVGLALGRRIGQEAIQAYQVVPG
jgi:hypothetical protein